MKAKASVKPRKSLKQQRLEMYVAWATILALAIGIGFFYFNRDMLIRDFDGGAGQAQLYNYDRSSIPQLPTVTIPDSIHTVPYEYGTYLDSIKSGTYNYEDVRNYVPASLHNTAQEYVTSLPTTYGTYQQHANTGSIMSVLRYVLPFFGGNN